jgi:hypothetical protein
MGIREVGGVNGEFGSFKRRHGEQKKRVFYS